MGEAVSKAKVADPGEGHDERVDLAAGRGRQQLSRHGPGHRAKPDHEEYDEGHHAHQGHPD